MSFNNFKWAPLWIKYGWALSITIWTIIGSILLLLANQNAKLGVLFLVAYAAFSSSGVFGFILGLKSVNSTDESTHLQQIADWLTKLLLGASLVELDTISIKAYNLSEKLGTHLNSDLATYIVLFSLIAFSALGVITGYLWSQLHYGNTKP